MPVYNWYPSVLARANASASYVTHKFHEHLNSIKADPAAQEGLKDWINTNLVIGGLGITDARDAELKQLVSDPEHAIFHFSKMISWRARIGWSTHGHSAVDVNIYSSGGPHAEDIRGNVENTDIGKFLKDYLNVDVDAVTKELTSKMDWEQSLPVSTDNAMVQLGFEMEEAPMYWVE